MESNSCLYEYKLNTMARCGLTIAYASTFYLGDDIPNKKLDNAIKKFAHDVNKNEILGLCDTTILSSGKAGYLFTETEIYLSDSFEKTQKVRYEEIKSLKMIRDHKVGRKQELLITLKDETEVYINSVSISKKPLKKFLEEMVRLSGY